MTLTVEAVGETELRIARRFAAPRDLLFRVMTEPKCVRQWLAGPPGWVMEECAIDLMVGGKFRFEWKGPKDERMAMVGETREIDAPKRLVQMESFEIGCEPQGGEQVATMVLTALAGGAETDMEIMVAYPSPEARDGALASGMEHGLAASYGAIDSMVQSGAEELADG